MRVLNMLDKKANRSLVHPSLDDESWVETTPRGVNRAKVMDLLGVTDREEQLQVDRLLSAGSNDEYNGDEDADDVCRNGESLNTLGKGKHMRLRVAKTRLVHELAISHWGMKLLEFQCLANMSVVSKNPNLCVKPSSIQRLTEKGDKIAPSGCAAQGRTFPLPPLSVEKHLLPSPIASPSWQRKEEPPVAHPLPQPPLLRSSSDQLSVSQVVDRKEHTSWRLQSIDELTPREAVPLPSGVAENAKAAHVSSSEALNQRLITSMVHKACFTSSPPSVVHKACSPSSSSATESSRTSHVLPSLPSGGSDLNPSTPPLSQSPLLKPLCPRKWRKGAVLGQGTFGIVHEGLNLEDGSFFAVKVSSTDDASPQIQQEVDLLSKLEHPNIVRYLGSSIEEGRLCIFLELVRMGSLEVLLRKYKRFEENTIRSYTRQILHGLEYLHANKTIHRDIKCGNILVDVNGQVKLSDFGVAKQVGETLAYSSKGTPLYMAPEVLTPKQKCYSFSADIWSLGCTVLEMAAGKPPWSNLKGFGFLFKVKNGELPPMPQHLSLEGQDFVYNCLRFDAKDRPSASELLQHPFVRLLSSLDSGVTRACSLTPSSFPDVGRRMSVYRPSSCSMMQCTL